MLSTNSGGKVDLNVMDDENSGNETGNTKKVMNKLSRLSTGFARLIVCEETRKDEQKRSSMSAKATEEKVHQYLDGLDSVVISFKTAAHNDDGLMMTATSTSPSSSNNSVFDSKKNLIIPVCTQEQVQTQPAKQQQQQQPQQQQSSVCTLSTTSSSCISDEGCYGSSDFSSEKDSQLKQLQQYKQLVVLNKQPISYASCTNATATVTGNTTATSKFYQQQQNYYINNLSRFEKIYNNELSNTGNKQPVSVTANVVSTSQISPYLVRPNSHESSNSSMLSTDSSPVPNTNNIQVVAAISGSYV